MTNAQSQTQKRKIIIFSGMLQTYPTFPYAPRPRSTLNIPPKNKVANSPCLDFDGTIFMQDTGHILFDNHGCGAEARNKLDEQIKSGERSFRDVSEEMWGSLHIPFDDGFTVMEKTLEIDPGFREFHQYCVDNGFPFHVISAGLKPVLRRVLDTFLGAQEVCSTQA